MAVFPRQDSLSLQPVTCTVLNSPQSLIIYLDVVALGNHFSVLMPFFSISGTYTEIKNATDTVSCIRTCCNNSSCHVAMLHDQHCFSIQCKDTQACQLTPRAGTSLVVVRDIESGGSGEDAEWVGEPK